MHKAFWFLFWLLMWRRVRRGPFLLTRSCVTRVRHMVGVSRSKEERLLTLSLLSFKTTIQMPIEHKCKSSPEQRSVFTPKFRDEFFSGAEQFLHGQSASAPSLKLQHGALPQYLKLSCEII